MVDIIEVNPIKERVAARIDGDTISIEDIAVGVTNVHIWSSPIHVALNYRVVDIIEDWMGTNGNAAVDHRIRSPARLRCPDYVASRISGDVPESVECRNHALVVGRPIPISHYLKLGAEWSTASPAPFDIVIMGDRQDVMRVSDVYRRYIIYAGAFIV